MAIYRYSIWDGTQDIADLEADDIMKALSDDVLNHGDLSRALQRLMQRGVQGDFGRLKGLRDLMEDLRAVRQQTLNRYDVGSMIDEIKERLDKIVRTEREGIERRLNEARRQPGGPQESQQKGPSEGQQAEQQAGEPTGQQSDQQVGQQGEQQGGQRPSSQGSQQGAPNPDLLKTLENITNKKLSYLDELPKDPGGMIQQLSSYDFFDPDARQQFQELMQMLQQQMMNSMFKNMQQALQDMTPQDMEKMRQMLQSLNQMLEQRARGEKPNFEKFMREFGQYFPDNPKSLDELIENLRRRIAQMQSLMDSMSREQRQTLQDMLNQAMMNQPGLMQELAQLSATMEQLFPSRDLRRRYPFQGDESLTLNEALNMMEHLQEIDDLEKQLRQSLQSPNDSEVDADKLREVLGEDAYQNFKQLQEMAKMLEEAGYLKFNGSRMELTPRGMRKIGQKALQDIFSQIKKDQFGKHATDYRGTGTERVYDVKKYEYGDAFHLQLERTLSNAVIREGPTVPLKLKPEDFEVYQTQYLTDSATVMMLDLSWSMGLRGNFLAAKKVALALYNLIRSQFPRDSLYIIGFSRYARQLTPEELFMTDVDELLYGTNMHQALGLARLLLRKHKTPNRQIIMVSDGEPTAHMEGKQAYFAYPTSYRTIQLTLQEAKHCTREGIVINTFMMDNDYHVMDFVDRLTRVNRGRVFYTTADQLGQYILVDYISSKKKWIRS